MKQFIKKQINKTGFDIVKTKKEDPWPSDFESIHKVIEQKVRPFTMTSRERIFGLIEAVKYATANKLEGDVVECGVWKGGSMLAVAETLTQLNQLNKELYLYDTFEGMPEPGKEDVSFNDEKASSLLHKNENKEKNLVWAYSALDTVQRTMGLSSYPQSKIHYIKGKVEDTIPSQVPEKISILRLDTDWYDSTKHELIHLFPRLVKGGVLIIDDYGYWKGARKAVDEYISENKIQILLSRMDDTGRIGIKQN